MTTAPAIPEEDDPTRPASLILALEAGIGRVVRWAGRNRETTDDKAIRMQRGLSKLLSTHIRRLEYQLRCFVIFLAARLIENGCVDRTPAPKRKVAKSYGKGLIQQQDEELRELLSGRIRISGFTITTPVIDGKGRRKSRRRSTYKMLPDDLWPIEAGHLFARLERLPRLLTRVDLMAERLASRAFAATKLPQPVPLAPPVDAHVSRFKIPPDIPFRHPLFLEPLGRTLAPDVFWEAAEHEDDRQSLLRLHLLAQSTLYKIGLPIGPDPRRRVPDLSKFDPPKIPQVRSV